MNELESWKHNGGWASLAGLAVFLVGTSVGLAQSGRAETGVRAYLSGQITVNTEIDSTRNYEGFEIIVAQVRDGVIDTLGFAVSGRDGRFAADVRARERGVYAMLVKRLGVVLNTSELVVANGDSSVVSLELPLAGRLPRIRSKENAAWTAFRNTDALHNEHLLQLFKDGTADAASVELTVRRSADMLWGLQDTFPGTLGGAAAAVKSLTMLEDWNDSLVVARTEALDSDVPGYVEAIRSAHRATARLLGLDAAISVVERAMSKTTRTGQLAELEATIVQAHLDSLQGDRAAIAARSIQQTYEGSLWAIWANRAEYEARNLMPGMPAPPIQTVDRSDEPFDLQALRGRMVVLEFWDPEDGTYGERVADLNALAEELSEKVTWVTMALNPDPGLIAAFLEGRSLPGVMLQDAAYYNSEFARRYNVNVLPTRYLIDEEGRIVKKYLGDALLMLAEDLRSRFAAP